MPQNSAEAAKWYRKSADQGEATGQHNLASMYYYGQGVPQNYVQAYKWLNLAAAGNTVAATEYRGKALKNRDIIAKKMTPAQIAEAQILAREWKPK